MQGQEVELGGTGTQGANGSAGNVGIGSVNASGQSGEMNGMDGDASRIPVAPKKSKVALIVILAVVVVVMVVGAVLLIMRPWEGKNKVDDDTNANTSKDEGVDDIDAEARMLYETFAGSVNTPADGMWWFRADPGMNRGRLDKYLMLTIARHKLEPTVCSVDYTASFGRPMPNNCISGEAMRAKVMELFGQELQFVDGDQAGQICGGFVYNEENDEFFEAGDGCGFLSFTDLFGVISEVERKDGKIYIYEKALLVDVLPDDYSKANFYRIKEIADTTATDYKDQMAGEYVGSVNVPYGEDDTEEREDYYERWDEALTKFVLENGDDYKWVFKKGNNGKYMLEKVERINGGSDDEASQTLPDEEKEAADLVEMEP